MRTSSCMRQPFVNSFLIPFFVKVLNHPNTTCGDAEERKNQHYCITDLSSYVEQPDITDVPYDHQFILGFKNNPMDYDDIFGEGVYDHFMSNFWLYFYIYDFFIAKFSSWWRNGCNDGEHKQHLLVLTVISPFNSARRHRRKYVLWRVKYSRKMRRQAYLSMRSSSQNWA